MLYIWAPFDGHFASPVHKFWAASRLQGLLLPYSHACSCLGQTSPSPLPGVVITVSCCYRHRVLQLPLKVLPSEDVPTFEIRCHWVLSLPLQVPEIEICLLLVRIYTPSSYLLSFLLNRTDHIPQTGHIPLLTLTLTGFRHLELSSTQARDDLARQLCSTVRSSPALLGGSAKWHDSPTWLSSSTQA